jgi:WbqC-like protein family
MSENPNQKLLIEAHYLPSIAWMKLISEAETLCLDTTSHFVKASYRNRCHILSPNGVLHLSVPLQHNHERRNTMGNVKISYEMNWQKNHWMTIISCYRRSAYFEYFEDMIAPLYHKRFETLLEWNLAHLETIFKILGNRPVIEFTNEYITPGNTDYRDCRNTISPKNNSPFGYTFEPYNQVFSDRFPFFENLSILDAIFNNGKFNINEL